MIALALRTVTLLLVMAQVPAAGAAELLSASVTREGKRFSVAFAIRVDAPAPDLRRLLDDYTALARLSPSTLSSRLIKPGVEPNKTESPWVAVTLRPCILIFCKTLQKVSTIVQESEGTTRYDSLPGRDSFEFAQERLRIRDDTATPARRATLTYVASLEPGFYVPSVLGPWIVRRVVIREMVTAANRAEQIIAAAR